MNWVGRIANAIESIGASTARPNLRNFIGEVDAENDPRQAALNKDQFVAEQSYFSVKIAEMRLAEAGRYFSEFLPMCSCFLRYTYGRSQKTLPFFLGNEFIKSQLGGSAKDAPQNIQFKNVYIVQNVPMKSDNLLMYSALCRVADSKFARSMLDFLSDTASTLGGAAVGSAVKTGVDLTKSLATLLGSDDITTRFGMLNGSILDTSGYRMLAGVTAADLKDEALVVSKGQLVRKVNGTDTTLDDVDYLVLALEYKKTLVDAAFAGVSTLPFHAKFDEVRTKLVNGDKDGARAALKPLLVDVVTSPDLTEADRLAIHGAYQASFDDWAKAVGGPSAGGNTMGVNGSSSDLGDKLVDYKGPAAKLVEAARVGMHDTKERADRRTNLRDQAAVTASLGRRAAAISDEAFKTVASEHDLSRASLALLSASLEIA